jgi:hypothetical protein
MVTTHAYIGRCAMSTERLRDRFDRPSLLAGLLLMVLLLPLRGLAEPPPAPVPAAQAAHQVVWAEGLRGRLAVDEPSAVRNLDPAIFTEISPVTASEPALRLPRDQQDEETPVTQR